MSAFRLTAPFQKEELAKLRAGDRVLVSGIIYTARDAAHGRFCAALDRGEELPVDLRGQTIFYAGPTPTPPAEPAARLAPPPACAWMRIRPRCFIMA